MSTRNETWLIYGYSLPYDSKLVDRIYEMPNEDEINLPWCGENAENKIGLLIDGMCGDYILCGKVMAVANEENAGFPLMAVPVGPWQSTEKEIDEWLVKNDLANLCDQESSRLWLVTHWH